jgi:hypothetical protein
LVPPEQLGEQEGNEEKGAVVLRGDESPLLVWAISSSVILLLLLIFLAGFVLLRRFPR